MKIKPEHSGAKNGGGHWGPRKEAKVFSKLVRRQQDKLVIKEQLQERLEYAKETREKTKENGQEEGL